MDECYGTGDCGCYHCEEVRKDAVFTEREACAKVAAHFWSEWDNADNMKCAEIIEQAIYARGERSK